MGKHEAGNRKTDPSGIPRHTTQDQENLTQHNMEFNFFQHLNDLSKMTRHPRSTLSTVQGVLRLQTKIGNQATRRLLMRREDGNTEANMIQRSPAESGAATESAPAHDPAEWNSFVTGEIQDFLNEFQNIDVVVSPPDSDEMVFETVHPPYYLNAKYTENSVKRIEAAEAARKDAPEYVKSQLFKGDDMDKPTALATGRSSIHQIREVLQGALDKGLIKPSGNKEYPDSKDLRAWLKKYGIGVDCSAFVQQALGRIMASSYAAVGETPGKKNQVGSIQSTAALKDVKNELKKNDRFEEVATPGEARPGDILTKSGHIRIVMSVQNSDDGGIIITYAEATSAKDVPSGESEKETDIGPRAFMVKYPAPDSAIGEQMPVIKSLGDKNFHKSKGEKKYTLGRFKALDKFASEHAAPEDAQEELSENMDAATEDSPSLSTAVDAVNQTVQGILQQENMQ